jgi:hypothetical protein
MKTWKITIFRPGQEPETGEITTSDQPKYDETRAAIEHILGGDMERVRVFWPDRYTDMFVDEIGGPRFKNLPVNPKATEIYHNNVRVHDPALLARARPIYGTAVLFDEPIWDDPKLKSESASQFGAPIFTYSRAQAIADGVLVDVTKTAKEAGIKFPVALTDTVHRAYVEVPDGVVGQDERGRLWDILFMFAMAARRSEGDTLFYELHVRNDNREGTPPLVRLKAVCGPGDDLAPVITIMMPDED